MKGILEHAQIGDPMIKNPISWLLESQQEALVLIDRGLFSSLELLARATPGEEPGTVGDHQQDKDRVRPDLVAGIVGAGGEPPIQPVCQIVGRHQEEDRPPRGFPAEP